MTRFIVIKSSVPYESLNKWVEHEFLFDKKRKNKPESWFVYNVMRFNIEGNALITISFSDDKDKAMNEANYLYYSHAHVKNTKTKCYSISSKKEEDEQTASVCLQVQPKSS